MPEERLRIQFIQPGLVEARTNLFVRPELNVFPLLLPLPAGETTPVVLGYREAKGTVGLDRSYGKFYASIGHNVQVENPFTYQGPLDPALSTLVLSYPELVTHLDFRDDRVHSHKGAFLGNTLQVAGGIFGGSARDVKVQPEVRTYVPLGSRATLASRASVGFLFPGNYGDVVRYHLADGSGSLADRVRDIETVLFRGFFSGGPSSNRGFPVRGVSPHGLVPFLNPATAAQQLASNCNPSSPIFDPASCSVPIGGFTLWELSNELRFIASSPLSASIFCDMSDVSPSPMNVRFDHLHLSCGAGGRYDTPAGPIRVDIGYRIQPLQVLGFRNEDDVTRSDPLEGVQPRIFGAPIAIAFGIGEAF